MEDVLEIVNEIEDEDYEIVLPRRRGPRKFRDRIDHFEKWDEMEFFERFRMHKRTTNIVLEMIQDKISSRTVKNRATSPSLKLLTTSVMASTSMRRGHPVFDTGEAQGVQLDAETGEVLTPLIQDSRPSVYGDCETGEQTQIRIVYQRSKFRVPRSALKLPVFETAVHDSSKKSEESLFNPTLLVLPLLMLLPGWATVVYIMAEVICHSWSHRGDSHRPLATPLQLMFHHKCAECLAHRQMQKVGQLQDKRTLKINSRRILKYDYAQFGIGS